jgi:hypothetical protein
MANATKPNASKQGRAAKATRGRNRANLLRTAEFAPGSLEAELSAIGRSVPAGEWAKVPDDYFANLDHYLYGAPGRK